MRQTEFRLELRVPGKNVAGNAERNRANLRTELADFHEFGQKTRQFQRAIAINPGETVDLPVFVNEFWTARQREANSLHEISYRACFKPQLPRFFIERLTSLGEVVYDPFMGRGTTLIKAALLGRTPIGCDVNPLSAVLTEPRLRLPFLDEVSERLDAIDFNDQKFTKTANLLGSR